MAAAGDRAARRGRERRRRRSSRVGRSRRGGGARARRGPRRSAGRRWPVERSSPRGSPAPPPPGLERGRRGSGWLRRSCRRAATASPVWTPQCTCTRPPARARWRSTPACTASLARWKTDIVASPWMASPMRRPLWRSTARSTTSRCSASRPGAASGSSCHSRVEATTSVARKVTTPVGRGSLSQPARSSSTSSPGVAVRCAGWVASPRRSACSSRAARSWSTSSQAGRMPDGGCPVSRAKAVAARPYTSAARVGTAPAATSGAR